MDRFPLYYIRDQDLGLFGFCSGALKFPTEIFYLTTAQLGNVDCRFVLWLVEKYLEGLNFHWTVWLTCTKTTERKSNIFKIAGPGERGLMIPNILPSNGAFEFLRASQWFFCLACDYHVSTCTCFAIC